MKKSPLFNLKLYFLVFSEILKRISFNRFCDKSERQVFRASKIAANTLDFPNIPENVCTVMASEKKYLLPAALGALLAAALFYWVAPKFFVNGQNASVIPTQSAQPTPKVVEHTRPRIVTEATPSEPILPPAMKMAATQNARLKYNLEWVFGNKRQRGWYIYVPLIQHTIGTERAPEMPEFAFALSRWQEQMGFAPTGMLDSETLYSMVKWWQARRLNSSVYASPESLLTVPATDFYDPEREADLRRVERETYRAYKQMVAAAIVDKSLNLTSSGAGGLAAEEKFLKIISSFRSREYQDKLRRQSPGSGRAGLAVNSPHFTGRALDIYVGGEPVETKDYNRAFQTQTPVYKWLVKNAVRFGFYPYYYEPWHWEYVPQNLKSADLQTQ